MIFTKENVAKYSNLGIKINGKTLTTVDKVKFFGLIFRFHAFHLEGAYSTLSKQK